MKSKKQYKLIDKFLEISHNSMMWKKWVIDDDKCSDYDKSIISSHYTFSSNQFVN